MAKKWKAYPWPDRVEDSETLDQIDEDHSRKGLAENLTLQEKRDKSEPEEEEIDVVGDVDNRQSAQQTCWGPHSPTAGATAPSPPPLNASGALYYRGELITGHFQDNQVRGNWEAILQLFVFHTTPCRNSNPVIYGPELVFLFFKVVFIHGN